MRSRLALTLALIITSGCTDPREPEPPCRCEGAVPGGTLELACGASTCVGGVGYRCDGPNRAATDPSACAPIEEDDAGTTPDGGADAGAPCRAETNARLCNDADLFCGPLETVDSCGEARSLSCGTCSAPDTCGGGGIPG